MNAPELLHPRAMVLINNIPINFNSFEVDTNNYYQADNFRVQAPIKNQPPGVDLECWMSEPAILVEIKAGYPTNPQSYNQNDLETLIIGAIEPLKINVGTSVIGFGGRDLTSKLIDTKIYEKYQNLTLSQIAEKFALMNGLKPVITKTATRAGAYYQEDYVNIADSVTTQWDLLVNLAAKEQMLVYVDGMSLILKPKPQPTAENIYPVDATKLNGIVNSNVNSLTVDRNLKFANDVTIEVRTHSLTTGKPETIRIQSTKNHKKILAGAAQPVGKSQVFSYVEDNLTPQQALDFAYSKLHEISQFEKVINFSKSADLKLKKDSVIKLTNCSPGADQYYYVDSIQRKMSMNPANFSMAVRAKNHSPDTVKLL